MENIEDLSASTSTTNLDEQESLEPPVQLKPLASLNWPYVPEDSSNDDPLKRADPKVLQLPQYEAIGKFFSFYLQLVSKRRTQLDPPSPKAMSPQVRKVLEKHDKLPGLLAQIDKLRGREREEALQQHLGVTSAQIDTQLRAPTLDENTLALRELAEAIEGAVRRKDPSALGLDWGE